MYDPYLYENSAVLRNILNIREEGLLKDAEADYVVFRLKDIAFRPLSGDYSTKHLMRLHWYLFQDLYEWAGRPRTIQIYKEEGVLGGLSIEYSEPDRILPDTDTALEKMRAQDWQGMEQETLTKAFSASLAALWKIHPFREGNTRTTVTFCCQFLEDIGLTVNRELFEQNSRYVRTALVAYNAAFSDGSDYSKKEYLEKIVNNAVSGG